MTRGSVIKEVKVTLTGERQQFVCQVLDRSETFVAVLYPISARRRVGDLVLPKGAWTYGYFWRDRPYNVYHWVRRDGHTLGYYVNLTDQVHIRPHEVEWRDLSVDLLFSPDGRRLLILDEAEVEGASPELRAKIDAARSLVLTHRDELLAEISGLTQHLRRQQGGSEVKAAKK